MKELALEVLELQEQWTDRNTPAMHRRGAIIRDQIPAWLRSHAAELSSALGFSGSDLAVEGRDGTGRKTEIPWVRFFSKSRSPNAREGWYCVYLFHALGNGFYLCLGHGSTRYEGGEFRPRSSQELNELVTWARNTLGSRIESIPGAVTEIDLGARTSVLGRAYAQGTVAGIWYPRDAIPPSSQLAQDARHFASILGELYDQQDLGRLPGSVPPEIAAASVAVDSIAHPLRRSKASGQGYGLTAAERCAVELHAMSEAIEHLSALGFSVEDVSATESFDLRASRSGCELIVEVKGTTGGAGSILLTANEVAEHIAAYPNNALVVVSEINLDRRTKVPSASGGFLRKIQPWLIAPAALTPAAYRYAVPPSEADEHGDCVS